MKYYCELYWSENLQEKKKEILSKLEQNRVQLNKYLIVLTETSANHLEFFDSVLLKQRAFEQKELFLIGIADGYSGALKLVKEITQEVYDVTKGTDIRQYLLAKQKEFEERLV